MPSGAILRKLRPLDDIRADLDAGPETYKLGQAARVLGVLVQTLSTWADRGDVARRPTTHTTTGRQRWVFHRDDLWRLAQALHGRQPSELDNTARSAVLRMLARWDDCAETAQELHDRAGVRPLPPTPDESRSPRAREYISLECPMCGGQFLRLAGSSAKWRLCQRCSSRVRKRTDRLTRAFVDWARARA